MLTEGSLPSSVQRRIYRRRGYAIADDVEFGPGAVVEGQRVSIAAGASLGIGTILRGREIRIGRRVEIGSFCIIEGGNVEIGDDTVLREQTFVGGPLFPDSELAIGKRVRVFQSCFLNPSRPLRIGDDTGVGGRSSIFTHGSWQPVTDGFPVTFEPVTIGRCVWLPWHVFVLPGVEIGDFATIGAGSVINRSIPARSLAAGVPARVIKTPDEWPRRLDDAERWQLLIGIMDAFAAYLESNQVLAEMRRDERRAVLSLDHAGRRRSVVAIRDGLIEGDGADIAIVLSGVHDTSVLDGASWFDLERKRKQVDRGDPLVVEADEFLARYGLRFVPVGEE